MAMEYWNVRTGFEDKARELTEGGLSPLVALIMASRGCTSVGEARELLRDDIGLLHDPMLMRDMDRAVERISLAIERREHIAVFGDYDVDGLTSTAIVADFLRGRGLTCDVKIPERLTEGYGLSDESVTEFAENGVSLIITVDCGITAAAQVALGRSLGVDFVITDHHKCSDELPDAYAVVDPLRPDCEYPFKGLAGVGVAFKLVCALEGADRLGEVMEKYVELVALGTIADIMPVTGENRAMIRHGIRIYRNGGGRMGILSLMNQIGVKPLRASDVDISFSIIPKLNAAGRMGRVEDAFELLMADSPVRASELAATLCSLNTQRRAIEDRIFAEALSRLPDVVTSPIVLADENWHHGVSGIVASRLMERFGVPVVIICIEDGIGRGSCRSWEGFPIYDALCSMSDRLISFGGHAFAAGVNLYAEEIDGFRDALAEYYAAHTGDVRAARLLPIDAELTDLSILTLRNIEDLYMLAPWGNGSPPPMLCLKDARVDQILSIGGDKHVKMRVSRPDGSVECIFFSKRLAELELREGSLSCLAFEPSINDFHGSRTVQLLLRDAVQSGADEHISYYLCSRFLGGEEISPGDRDRLRPSRDDLARLWRVLAARRPEIRGSRTGVLRQLTEESGMAEACRTYISLQVFRELRLISLSEHRGMFTIRIPGTTGKVDLGNSVILNRLTPTEAPGGTT